ncbi:MAG: hypothetical protein SGILL_006089, partial [Bacillariaceae sp.]
MSDADDLESISLKALVVEGDEDEDDGPRSTSETVNKPGDQEEVEYRGAVFRRGEVFQVAIGERRIHLGLEFFSKTGDQARMVLLAPLGTTFMGKVIREVKEADADKWSHLPRDVKDIVHQVRKDEAVFPCGEFLKRPQKARMVPLNDLLLDNCTKEDIEMPAWGTEFGPGKTRASIFNTKVCRGPRRAKPITVLDSFCGAGGFSEGMRGNKNWHFKIGVEKDPFAARAAMKNHGAKLYNADEDRMEGEDGISVSVHLRDGSIIFYGSVDQFFNKVENWDEFRSAVGEIDYGHLSPPCQGFSAQNTLALSGPEREGDRANNLLSLTILRVAKVLCPKVITFENVVGIWNKRLTYLYPIYLGLFLSGYHFRQGRLKACDYGDPQERQRFILIAAQSHVLLPRLPPKTHGVGSVLYPYVTCREAIGHLEHANNGMLEDDEQEEKTRGGGDDKYKCTHDKPAPAILASKSPRHYCEDRVLTLEETKALTFRPGFKTCGS